tara:strand:+ start:2219 stop:2704 length:486 start_codon:yes stop_codon:yes gene_type:complete
VANRAIDLLITYRVIKLLVTPFNKQEAFAQGIIDKDGKILKKYKTLKTSKEKKSYTMLHRFVFNLKRILAKVGIRGALGSFAVALALLIKEDTQYADKQKLIESAVIKYLKETNQYDEILNNEGDIFEANIPDKPINTCFGIDVYEVDGELLSEQEYAKTL